MTGTERRRQLLVWLNEAGSLSLQELVGRFGVSKMTVHRDLALLERRQALRRIHGGAIAVEKERPASGVSAGAAARVPESCGICQRPVSAHLLYSLTLPGGAPQPFCCAHCGVSAQLGISAQPMMIMTTDFLSGRPHPAQHSWFVLGSDVVPCCRPSMLTFEDQAMARRFQSAFGGQLGRLSTAIDFLREEMGGDRKEDGCPHCASAGRPGIVPARDKS